METDRDVHQRRVISESALHVIKLFQGTYILPLSRYRLRRNNNVHLNWTMNVTFIPFLMFALLFLSLLVVTQIRGHIAGSSPPIPTTVRALHFYRDNTSALSSRVDSHRIVLTHARRSQQLILILYVYIANKFKISPRRDSNSRTNPSSIRGPPLVHRGDRLTLKREMKKRSKGRNKKERREKEEIHGAKTKKKTRAGSILSRIYRPKLIVC